MRKLFAFVAIIIVAAAAGYFAAGLRNPAQSTHTETAFERVMRTKTIRCGYALWPPSVLSKDPNSGMISGFAANIMETIAAKNGLSVKWVEETGWGDYAEGLQSGRFDAFCSLGWLKSDHASNLRYSIPVAYSSLHFYARADDHRFDEGLDKLDDPTYTLSVMDGEISHDYASDHYPKAKQIAIPQIADITQIFLNVATGKADGVFNDPSLARDFASKNPGQLRQVSKIPLAVYANVYAVAFRENDLADFFNTTLIEMHNFGEIDRIIAKYEPDRSAFLPVARPYASAPAPALP